MSEAIAFDTHRFVKRLTQTGFTEALAEEQVTLLNGNLATKRDLLEAKVGLERQLAEVKGDLERQLANVKADMSVLKWMVGLVIVVQILPMLKSLFN